jgi:predicted DNA-binding protein (MmcQ/YjbR family)
VSADNVLYFADGTNIRMVDRDGIVTTIIGNHMHKSHWKPIPCEGTLNVEEVFSFLNLTHFIVRLLVGMSKSEQVKGVFLASK